MADLTVSAAEVYTVSGREKQGVAGQAITKGQALAYDGSDGRYYLADNDSATAARKTISGIALEAASAVDVPFRIQKSGVVYLGAVTTKGTVYAVSSNAGGICPYSDVNTGDDIILVGVGGVEGDPESSRYMLTLIMKDTNTAQL